MIFQILCHILRDNAGRYILIATAASRLLSAVYNYYINYRIVFRSGKIHLKTGTGYIVLAVFQMLASAFLTEQLVFLTCTGHELLVKIPVDLALFFVSYVIQKKLIFARS